MLPKPSLPSVRLLIPGEQFADALRDIAEWLAGEHVTSPSATCRRSRAGRLNVRIAFSAAQEAKHFAKSFGGRYVV